MPTSKLVNDNPEPVNTGYLEQDNESSLELPEMRVAQDVDAVIKHQEELNFLNEPVKIMILPSNDPDDSTRLVTISVNGKDFNFLRGEYRTAPRYVLYHLATLKRQAFSFSYKFIQGGNTAQTTNQFHTLRYPHQFEDTNPKGVVWYNSIRDRAF